MSSVPNKAATSLLAVEPPSIDDSLFDSGSEESFTEVLVPLIVGCALFMELLDSTVITTALPAMARSLHEDPIKLNLAITSYLLSLAVFIPVSAWVADRFGARIVFRTAIVIFTIGSVFCGISHSLPELVAARILQGCGGAMMVPVGRLVILKTVPKRHLVTAMSYLSIPALIGPVVGPPVGGFIVTYSTWRWIFFINVPICLIGIVMVTLFIKDIREDNVPPLDLLGFVLTGVGLAALVFGFESVGRGELPPVVVFALMAGGASCMGLYVLHYNRARHPIINLGLLRIMTFRISTVGGGLFRMGIGAMPFLLALLLQLAFGINPFKSGLIIFASALGALTMKLAINPIIRLFGFRSLLIFNGVISAFFMLCCALFRPTTPHLLIALVLFSGGFFRSLQFTCINALGYADVPSPLMSNASSLASMGQQLSISLGVAIAALALRVGMTLHHSRVLTARDIVPAFLLTGGLGLLGSIVFLPLPHNAGAELAGRRGRHRFAEEDTTALAD
ncbi:MAG TPA: DHA2 family efflux MFS transporter permease subunit [Candidatus Binataceae bacterium]|nr:DHA2 family efflux MFS transporter permease subunit [Candidatus Binataceae bacterium]